MADLTARYRVLLNEAYARKVNANARFTQNAFAKYLGVNRTYLSKILNGKILLSLDVAERMIQKLNFDQSTRAEFLLSAAEEQRCHALYLIDPSLTDCDPEMHSRNLAPAPRSRKKGSKRQKNSQLTSVSESC